MSQKKAPRFLFIHGVDDTVVPISQSKALYDRLILAGVSAEYVALPNAPHGFIGPELPKPEYRTVQDNMALFIKNTLN